MCRLADSKQTPAAEATAALQVAMPILVQVRASVLSSMMMMMISLREHALMGLEALMGLSAMIL